MKKLFLSFFLLSWAWLLSAQVYQIVQEPVCWTVGAVDSSLNRYVLISNLDYQPPRVLSYTNAAGDTVTVTGGTVNLGYCAATVAVDSNGMFGIENQLGSWAVTGYYIPLTHTGYMLEKSSFILEDSSASAFAGDDLLTISASSGSSNPPIVQLGSGNLLPQISIRGDTLAGGGRIYLGYGGETYDLPVRDPDALGLASGTYIIGVDELGARAGTGGWLNVYEGPIAYLRSNGDDATGEIGNKFAAYNTIDGVYPDFPGSNFFSFIADGNTYANTGAGFEAESIYFIGNGSTDLTNYVASPLFSSVSQSGLISITGVRNLNGDTVTRDSYLIKSNSGNPSVYIDVENINMVRPVLSGYFQEGLFGNREEFRDVHIRANNVYTFNNALMDVCVSNSLNVSIDKLIRPNKTTTSYNFLEAVIQPRHKNEIGDSITMNIDVGFFAELEPSTTKGGFFQLTTSTSNDTLRSSLVVINIDKYISNRQITPASFSVGSGGNVNWMGGATFRPKIVNSSISVNVEDIQGDFVFGTYNDFQAFNSRLSLNIGSAKTKNRVFQTQGVGGFASNILQDSSVISVNFGKTTVTNDVGASSHIVVDSTSKVYFTGRLESSNFPLYLKHDAYLKDLVLVNTSGGNLVNSGGTAITCYVCNTNVTQDDVGAGITVVDICPKPNGLFDATNNNDSIRVSQTYLTGNFDIDLVGNVLEIDDGGTNYARFSEVQGYMRTDSSFMGVFSSGPGIIENVSLLTAPTTGEIVMGKYPGVTFAHNFPIMQPDQYGASAGMYFRVVDEAGDLDGNNGWVRLHITGTGAPSGSVTPEFVGQEYLDTSANAWYKAYGLTNTDWQAL